ncbi:MAG: ArnT family glycosyltransferase [Candidatus Kerfeldbacteria bacterium]
MKLVEKYYKYIVALLLIIMLVVEITTALQESQTIDEGVHLSAGYSYLVKNDFRMNTEHPPFAKELSALPLLFISHKLDQPFDKPAWSEYNQWQFAKDLIYNNNIQADTIFFLGRIPTMILSILLGFFIFRWSKELFGLKAGLISLLFYTFSPNIIAHSRYVTTDIALALFFFITIYYFYKYLKSAKIKYFIYFCLIFGLAQASKFSAVILIPILVILLLIYILSKNNTDFYKKVTSRLFTKIIIVIISTFLTLFCVYGFEVKNPIDDINVKELYKTQEEILNTNQIEQEDGLTQKIISITDTNTKSGQNILNFAEKAPWPIFSYFNGFIKLFIHNYYGHMSYLLGEHSNMGWWYYFIIAFLVKTPLSTLLLSLTLVVSVIYWFFKKNSVNNKNLYIDKIKNIPLAYYFLVVPPLIHFVFSLTSHINLGLRHILLIYPFIFVGIGYFAKLRFQNIKKQKIFNILFSLIIIYYLISSIMIYPNYLAYFNEISGGPNNGTKYLVDSNIDWGQDIKKLKKYMDSNNINHICMSYFGQAELDYYGIDFRYIPDNSNFTTTEDLNCVVAISATSLFSSDKIYKWLEEYTPDTKIGYSIFIYDFRIKE